MKRTVTILKPYQISSKYLKENSPNSTIVQSLLDNGCFIAKIKQDGFEPFDFNLDGLKAAIKVALHNRKGMISIVKFMDVSEISKNVIYLAFKIT